jgi:hypothetical protein
MPAAEPHPRLAALPCAVDPPLGERAGSGTAITQEAGSVTINAGGPGDGLLGLPGSMAGGMAAPLSRSRGPAGGIWVSTAGTVAPRVRGALIS